MFDTHLDREHSRGWVNVRSVGAKCDDDTDDTDAIQRAMDEGNGAVLLPGPSVVSRAIRFNFSDMALVGLGPESVLRLRAGVKSNLVECVNSAPGLSNLLLANLTLDGNIGAFSSLTPDDAFMNGVWWTQPNDSEIRNVRVRNCGYHGIVLTEGGLTTNLRNAVVGCRVENCGQGPAPLPGGTANNGTGIFLEAGPMRTRVIGNLCRANALHGLHVKDAANAANQNVVLGNELVDNGIATGLGIRIEGANCQDNVIVGNVILGNFSGPLLDGGTRTCYAFNKDNQVAPLKVFWDGAQMVYLASQHTFQGGNPVHFDNGVLVSGGALQPSTPTQIAQAGAVYQGSGVPNNANGNNGDAYFRTDTPGVANQRLYVKSAGAWAGIL